TYDIQDDSSILPHGSPIGLMFQNAGTLKKSGSGNNISSQGRNISTMSATLTNSGTVCGESGNLRLTGGYFQTGGTTKVNNGTLTSTTPFNILGGYVIGNGVLVGT